MYESETEMLQQKVQEVKRHLEGRCEEMTENKEHLTERIQTLK